MAETFTPVDFVMQYGARCRECADNFGVCPGDGLPCADKRKAVEWVVDALEYGRKHGYIVDPPSRTVAEVFTLRRLGVRQKAKLLDWPRVLIQSNGAYWRADRCGYTSFEGAAEYTGSEAYAATNHCGPEKAVRYHLLSGEV
jgi:hypothetical protein